MRSLAGISLRRFPGTHKCTDEFVLDIQADCICVAAGRAQEFPSITDVVDASRFDIDRFESGSGEFCRSAADGTPATQPESWRQDARGNGCITGL